MKIHFIIFLVIIHDLCLKQKTPKQKISERISPGFLSLSFFFPRIQTSGSIYTSSYQQFASKRLHSSPSRLFACLYFTLEILILSLVYSNKRHYSLFSFIHSFFLSVCVCVCLLIDLYVAFCLSFDVWFHLLMLIICVSIDL